MKLYFVAAGLILPIISFANHFSPYNKFQIGEKVDVAATSFLTQKEVWETDLELSRKGGPSAEDNALIEGEIIGLGECAWQYLVHANVALPSGSVESRIASLWTEFIGKRLN